MKKSLPLVFLLVAFFVFFLGCVTSEDFNEYFFLSSALLFLLVVVMGFQRISAKEPIGYNLLFIILSLFGGAISSFFTFITWGQGISFGWGRPLRNRKQILHPKLTSGSGEWSRGAIPDCSALDITTRQALAELWYFDAEKEYASVPAFARMTWILTSLGASAKLLEKLHHCGLQEIEHTRSTLALANAYANRDCRFETMPEMMNTKIGYRVSPWAQLAQETFLDGCLVEGFNADVADEACRGAEDPAVLQTVRMIAKEERFHAEVAWEILDACLENNPEVVCKTLRRALAKVPPRGGFCYSAAALALLEKSNPLALQKHGRVLPHQWQQIYEKSVAKLRARLEQLLQKRDSRKNADFKIETRLSA